VAASALQIMTTPAAKAVEEDCFTNSDLGGDSSITQQLQAESTADIVLATSTSSSSKPEDLINVDPQSQDRQKGNMQELHKSDVQTQETPTLQGSPLKHHNSHSSSSLTIRWKTITRSVWIFIKFCR